MTREAKSPYLKLSLSAIKRWFIPGLRDMISSAVPRYQILGRYLEGHDLLGSSSVSDPRSLSLSSSVVSFSPSVSSSVTLHLVNNYTAPKSWSSMA